MLTHPDWKLSHSVRPIRPAGVWEIGDWRIKVASISGLNPIASPKLLAQARELAAKTLPNPAISAERYGVGFVIVHEAALFNTICVDWWERTNEIRHHFFRAWPGGHFNDITPSGEAVCVWELRVQAYEREAWMRHVIASPSGPDINAYLADKLSEDS